jgi:methylated-DNA-[protein]-cysteine S-methyltransferase
MNCRSVLTRIDALRTGELSGHESHDVESHLTRCQSCQASVDDVRGFAAVIRLITPAAGSGSRLAASVCADQFDFFDAGGHRVWVAFSPRGIRMVDVRSTSAEEFRNRYRDRFGRELRAGAIPRSSRSALVASLEGEPVRLPEIDLSALTDFEQQVLRTITSIPRGEVRSYEWVAAAVRRPKAIRAVGNVMAANPVPFLLPCHRVVPAAGGVGSYGFGPEMKKELLAAEGVPVGEIETLAKKHVRYIGSKTTRIFCFPTCRDARRIKPANRVDFRDASRACGEGFRPCKRCAPVMAA